MTDLERIKKDVVEMDSRANVCWYDTKVLTKAVRLILEELPADRNTDLQTETKTETQNSNLTFEKRCKGCKHYKLTCDLFSEVCKYEPTTEDCSTVDKDINVRSKTEPQTCSVNGRPYTECCNCECFKCTADEPQRERSE